MTVVDGKNILSVKLGLGMKGGDDSSVLSEKDSDLDHDEILEYTQDQDQIGSPKTTKKQNHVSGKAKRQATRSLHPSAISIFKKYYMSRDPMDENKNPYFHHMTHEMRSIILSKYEQDTSERKQLLEKLAAGEYPSLS